MDHKDGAQERSGHLREPSTPPSHSEGSDAVRETQPGSGYRDGAGAVNNSRDTGGSPIEGQDERGYRGDSTASASVRRAKDGVGSPLPGA
jgi:hypothetical protein